MPVSLTRAATWPSSSVTLARRRGRRAACSGSRCRRGCAPAATGRARNLDRAPPARRRDRAEAGLPADARGIGGLLSGDRRRARTVGRVRSRTRAARGRAGRTRCARGDRPPARAARRTAGRRRVVDAARRIVSAPPGSTPPASSARGRRSRRSRARTESRRSRLGHVAEDQQDGAVIADGHAAPRSDRAGAPGRSPPTSRRPSYPARVTAAWSAGGSVATLGGRVPDGSAARSRRRARPIRPPAGRPPPSKTG